MQKILGNLDKGLLFVVSAPSGTGKNTLVQMLLDEFSCVVESVSYTTRKPRDGEVDGVHYNFVSHAEFESKIQKGEFLEYAKVYDDFYGTSRSWVDLRREQGKHVVLVIDTQGALQVMKQSTGIFVFIYPPSMEELRARLSSRKTESKQEIDQRLTWAEREMEVGNEYEYQIVNDDLEIAYQVLKSILIAEEHRK